MNRLIAALIVVVVVTAGIQLISGSSPVGAQTTGSMTIRGQISHDGVPASPNAIVSVLSASGENLSSVFSGLADAPDEYELSVILNSRVESDEILTVTVDPGLGPVFNVIKRVKTRAISGATVTANLEVFTAVPSVVRVPDGGTSFASIPLFVSMSPEATANVVGGGIVTVIGGSIDVPGIGGDLTLPVAVPTNETLESLVDSDKGISLISSGQTSDLRITFLDDSRNEAISLLVETTPFIGDGTSATAKVTGLAIESATRVLDLTDPSSGLRTASLKLSAEVSDFPAQSDLEIHLQATPDESLLSSIDALFDPAVSFVNEVAFSGSFVDSNLESFLGTPTVRLGVNKSWLDDHADDSIEVFRVRDDGSIERNNWVSIDPDADTQQFDLQLEEGLTTVVVAAIEHVAVPTPTPRPAATPTPTPAPTATPVPQATSTPISSPTAAPAPAPTPSPVPTAKPIAAAETTDDEESEGGGSCSSTESGGPAAIGHLGLVALPLGLLIARRV